MQIFWSTPLEYGTQSFTTSGELPKIGDEIYLSKALESGSVVFIVEQAYHKIEFSRFKLRDIKDQFSELKSLSGGEVLDRLEVLLASPEFNFGGYEFIEDSKNVKDWGSKELLISRRSGEVILRKK